MAMETSKPLSSRGRIRIEHPAEEGLVAIVDPGTDVCPTTGTCYDCRSVETVGPRSSTTEEFGRNVTPWHAFMRPMGSCSEHQIVRPPSGRSSIAQSTGMKLDGRWC